MNRIALRSFVVVSALALTAATPTPTPTPTPKPSPSPVASPSPSPTPVCQPVAVLTYPPTQTSGSTTFSPQNCTLDQSVNSSLCIPGSSANSTQATCIQDLQAKMTVENTNCAESAGAMADQTAQEKLDTYCDCLQDTADDVATLGVTECGFNSI